MRRKINFVFFIAISLLVACSGGSKKAEPSKQTLSYQKADSLVLQKNFQKEIDGKKVDLFTLKNDSGVTIKITNYGARLVSILQPDRDGMYEDVISGYSTLDEYLKDVMYQGGIIGRFGNRIANGKYKIDGKEYKAPINNNDNSLHGGIKGFDTRVWDAKQEGNKLTLNYISADGEEGYPGELKVTVVYELTPDNSMKLSMEATTNKKTVVNLTNHAWFNLNGCENGDILNHEMEVNADMTTPVDAELIPLGTIVPVDATPFDFRKPDLIGNKIKTENEQLKFGGGGYDHNWVLNGKTGEMKLALRFGVPENGRFLEVTTTEPGLQMYSSNLQTGSVKGKKGKGYTKYSAMAIEPQHFPDSPNQPKFPTTLLNPGETYEFAAEYKFYVKK